MAGLDAGGSCPDGRLGDEDLAVFESQRARLVALAYRMLGDVGRAEDMVQEAWLRWQGRREEVGFSARLPGHDGHAPVPQRARLGARPAARRAAAIACPSRSLSTKERLGRIEALEQVSMAFLVMLQRLTPAERAVLLLHDVFDFAHAEIAALLDKNEAACRKLLERAREHVASEKRLFAASREMHQRLLGSFVQAASAGDARALVELLAEDAVLITDGGPEGRRGRGFRNLQLPAAGRRQDRRVRRRDLARLGPGGRDARAQRPARDGLLRPGPAVRRAPARGRQRPHPSRLLPRRRRAPATPRPATLRGA